ncbi:RNA-directed DNA polymerase [Actinoallomurus vinaceus]|uniref:RNA-directed DNA polymerase n=1 Tax=Actinoallomurus vinaceus TaxID=1080074 RepID=UPI0031E6BB96
MDEELGAAPRLLPPNAVAPALLSRRDKVAEWAHAQVSRPFIPSEQEIIAVSKARHGVRPVAIWDLPSRLLYRALTSRLDSTLTLPPRSSKAWYGFQWQPLDLPGEYIVAADIASCYELIDHGLLAEELLVQTDDHAAVDALMGLLKEASGRTYGLPQQSVASDVLAEVFLDKLERALVRRGLIVGRYNDDFRLNCDSWSDVVRSIETLSEEARRLGLILNDSKTFTWSRVKYQAHLQKVEDLRREIAEEAELDLAAFDADEYDGGEGAIELDQDAVEQLTAARILERWSRVAGRGKLAVARRSEHQALMQLLPVAFTALSATENEPDGTLDTAMRLLRYEQTTTPHVSRYLMSRSNDSAVLSAFDKLLRRNAYLTGWQTWWLQQPLSRLASFNSGRTGQRRVQWVRDAFTSAQRSPVLRAQAAMTLARLGLIDTDELVRVYDRSSPVVRPVIVSAIGFLKPAQAIRRAVTGASQLDQWAFDWAVQNA